MVNPAWFDATVLAALGCTGRMPNPVEGLVPDGDGKVRHAAGRQAHLAMTIGAGSHVIDGNSRF